MSALIGGLAAIVISITLLAIFCALMGASGGEEDLSTEEVSKRDERDG